LIPGNVTARDIYGALLTIQFSRIDLLGKQQREMQTGLAMCKKSHWLEPLPLGEETVLKTKG
jgi:hypothetical protein